MVLDINNKETPLPQIEIVLSAARDRASRFIREDMLPIEQSHITIALINKVNEVGCGDAALELNTQRLRRFLTTVLQTNHPDASNVFYIDDENLVEAIYESDDFIGVKKTLPIQKNIIHLDSDHLFAHFKDNLGTQHVTVVKPYDNGECSAAFFTKNRSQEAWHYKGGNSGLNLGEFSSGLLEG